jgi:GNAT superfamily N-acetyltransferase
MRVVVFDHTGISDEHKETFEGTPEQIEIYLRRAFPFLNREVVSGDVEGCLETIDEQQNYSVSIEEGENELKTHHPFLLKYLREQEDLKKMAIQDIPPGPQTGSISDGERTYHDYSHLLPTPARVKGYKLEVLDKKDLVTINGRVTLHGKEVGMIDGTRFGDGPAKATRVSQVEVHPHHRKQGLGSALYEALFAHAYHHHGVRVALGGAHSTSADATLHSLARKHGLQFTTDSQRQGPTKPDGAYDNAFTHYEIALKAEVNLAKEMQGLLPSQASYFDTARWMAGADDGISSLAWRSFLLKHDGDLEYAALDAYGLKLTEENLAALRGLVGSGSLVKAEEEPVAAPQAITPAHPDATEAAEEVRRGFEAGTFHIAKLNGKHSGGAMIGRDPQTQHLYLLKPGSGDNSPAAGVHEEDASQSRREVAFWYAADMLGLSEYLPRADLLYIDGQEMAAIRMLPLTFKNLGTALKQNPSLMPHCMRPYLYSGLIHKWAIMDWVLGNPDRHSQNLMLGDDDRTLRLIDHGSAMAGRSFDPAHDGNSFIPYYLRAWTGMRFSKLDDAQKARAMPTAGIDGAKAVERWLKDIDAKRFAAKLQTYGIDPEPMVERLEYIKMMPGPKDQAINKLWLGVGSERPL